MVLAVYTVLVPSVAVNSTSCGLSTFPASYGRTRYCGAASQDAIKLETRGFTIRLHDVARNVLQASRVTGCHSAKYTKIHNAFA
jgi:hypothetical protein